MSPRLSVITVTYNAEAFIGRTLRSIERAAYPGADIEWLVIDGGSQDGTLNLLKEAGMITPKILSEPDSGLYDAMNKGLSLATGEYVWFLNAGDEVFDESTFNNLNKYLNNQLTIYYSDALFVRDDGRAVGLRSVVTPHPLPADLSWRDMSLGMCVCHQAFIVRRNSAPKYLTDNLSADLDWEIESLKKTRQASLLPFILCRYLVGGLSVQHHHRSLIDRWKVLRKHFGSFTAIVNHFKIFLRAIRFILLNGKYW